MWFLAFESRHTPIATLPSGGGACGWEAGVLAPPIAQPADGEVGMRRWGFLEQPPNPFSHRPRLRAIEGTGPGAGCAPLSHPVLGEDRVAEEWKGSGS